MKSKENWMKKAEIIKKYTELMKKHRLPKEEQVFEKANLADWFKSCQAGNLEDLEGKVEYTRTLVGCCSKFDANQAYFECRSVYLEVAEHFFSKSQLASC